MLPRLLRLHTVRSRLHCRYFVAAFAVPHGSGLLRYCHHTHVRLHTRLHAVWFGLRLRLPLPFGYGHTFAYVVHGYGYIYTAVLRFFYSDSAHTYGFCTVTTWFRLVPVLSSATGSVPSRSYRLPSSDYGSFCVAAGLRLVYVVARLRSFTYFAARGCVYVWLPFCGLVAVGCAHVYCPHVYTFRFGCRAFSVRVAHLWAVLRVTWLTCTFCVHTAPPHACTVVCVYYYTRSTPAVTYHLTCYTGYGYAHYLTRFTFHRTRFLRSVTYYWFVARCIAGYAFTTVYTHRSPHTGSLRL